MLGHTYIGSEHLLLDCAVDRRIGLRRKAVEFEQKITSEVRFPAPERRFPPAGGPPGAVISYAGTIHNIVRSPRRYAPPKAENAPAVTEGKGAT